MQWKDEYSVTSLFARRRKLFDQMSCINDGQTECSIYGHYVKDKLSGTQKERLDAILRDYVTTEIAVVDGELAKLGVTVTDMPPD